MTDDDPKLPDYSTENFTEAEIAMLEAEALRAKRHGIAISHEQYEGNMSEEADEEELFYAYLCSLPCDYEDIYFPSISEEPKD